MHRIVYFKKEILNKNFRISMVTFCLLAGIGYLNAQSFERYTIGDSGCSARFPASPTWNNKTDENNNRTWSGAVSLEGTRYGILCIEFAEPRLDLTKSGLSLLLAEILDSYMEKFGIVENSGYQTGWAMESNPFATGITDSWTTKTMNYWRIKAWIDPYNLAFLYMFGESGIPDLKNMEIFLDGFRFPE